MRILVSGAASHLACALLPLLLADARVTRVHGIDLHESPVRHPKFTQSRLDVRARGLDRALRDVDAVVHLAFVVMPGTLGRRRHDRRWIRDINVRGSCRVFTTAARRGARCLVHVSSAAVYALPAPPGAIREDHARGAPAGFAYAEDKVAVEDWLEEFEDTVPGLRVVRLRPHVILGPHAQPYLRRLARTRFYPRLPDPAPLFQCVHEQDVAQAIVQALFGDARGAFNLACADALSLRDMKRLRHRCAIPVPLALARRLTSARWRITGHDADPAWMAGLPYGLVLDSGRARAELPWMPRFDSIAQCLRAT